LTNEYNKSILRVYNITKGENTMNELRAAIEKLGLMVTSCNEDMIMFTDGTLDTTIEINDDVYTVRVCMFDENVTSCKVLIKKQYKTVKSVLSCIARNMKTN
jgi:hypothetical protein